MPGQGILLSLLLFAFDQNLFSAQAPDPHYPAEYRQKLLDRSWLDDYQAKAYDVETEFGPRAYQISSLARPAHSNEVRIITLEPTRDRLPDKTLPTLGFRAPLFKTNIDAAELLPELNRNLSGDPVAEIVRTSLASDGLLRTLAKIVPLLGAESLDTDAAFARLAKAGFPLDWLNYFETENGISGRSIAKEIALSLKAGGGLENIDLSRFKFHFHQTCARFRVTTESGEFPPALLRLQIGGGYERGIVPGSSLEVTARLVEALPDAKFLMAVENTLFEPISWLASQRWKASRDQHITLLSVPFKISGWVQDNAKAGAVLNSAGPVPALLVPRYASFGDAVSLFATGESFVMEGIEKAGIKIIQSPLLFQGGNVLAIRDAARQCSVLIISDTALYHNTALGLSREQVIEAFRLEFGVHDCIVLSPASYHLDYEVTFRSHGSNTIAFVNDPRAAAGSLVQSGLQGLEQKELISPQEHAIAQEHLKNCRWTQLSQTILRFVERHRTPKGKFDASLASALRRTISDGATANLQCFLVATDILLAGSDEPIKTEDERRSNYLAALRHLLQLNDAFNAQLEGKGWRTIKIPSMPEFNFSINYLNAVQYENELLLPAWGGLYENLDRAAIARFESEIPKEVGVVPIPCAHSQFKHGAIHCMVSSFESTVSRP
jgi:hypothetical protein